MILPKIIGWIKYTYHDYLFLIWFFIGRSLYLCFFWKTTTCHLLWNFRVWNRAFMTYYHSLKKKYTFHFNLRLLLIIYLVQIWIRTTTPGGGAKFNNGISIESPLLENYIVQFLFFFYFYFLHIYNFFESSWHKGSFNFRGRGASKIALGRKFKS